MREDDDVMLTTDIVYKGCTRPALVLGVPVVPFVLGVGGTALACFLLLSPPWALLAIVVHLVFRQIIKRDDQQFSLLGVYMNTRMGMKNKKFWKADSFQPINYTRKTRKKRG